jgi:excisionase family DNA binding protein
MSAMVAIPMPDGRWLALSPEGLRSALAAGEALGLAVTAPVSPGNTAPEGWMNSEELGELLGLHSTTIEAMAKAQKIPSIRVGKALRFEPSAVKAALRA